MLGNFDVWETCNWNCDVSLCFVILEFSDVLFFISLLFTIGLKQQKTTFNTI